jgi:hypothetical protein
VTQDELARLLVSMNCPILERTADGRAVGRCWFYCPKGVCPRHGDVSGSLDAYRKTGRLTDEATLKPEKP